MQRVDSDRMNHGALHDYLLLLLSDAHLAVLRQDDGRSVHKELIQLTLDSIRKLRKDYYAAIIQRLNLVVAEDPELTALLATAYRGRMRAAAHERYLPLLVILITLIRSLNLYLISRLSLNVFSEVVRYRVYDDTAHPSFEGTLEGIALQAGQYLVERVIQYFICLTLLIYIPPDHTVKQRRIQIIELLLCAPVPGNTFLYQVPGNFRP